mmetsp:Transcript_3989/g.5310  ORF Transcript_3989/g.5310 Transcript_3989/m.5310 type:complete len:402 (+) Transcript_3989:118-1323(+)
MDNKTIVHVAVKEMFNKNVGATNNDKTKRTKKIRESGDVRCAHWIDKKRKTCSFRPAPGSEFCGNHNPEICRVPCPVDPNHTILESDLKKHIEICPARLLRVEAEAQAYYSCEVNAGSDDEVNKGKPEAIKPINGQLAAQRRELVRLLDKEEFLALVDKVRAAVTSACPSEVPEAEVEDMNPPECTQWMEAAFQKQHNEGAHGVPLSVKHCTQQAALAGQMKRVGLLPPGPQRTYVEMGAGRGYLTYMIAEGWAGTHAVLLERRSYRFKAERSLKRNSTGSVERIRIDLADFALHKAQALTGQDLILTGKHLCGAATDFALRSATHCRMVGRPDTPHDPPTANSSEQGIEIDPITHLLPPAATKQMKVLKLTHLTHTLPPPASHQNKILDEQNQFTFFSTF